MISIPSANESPLLTPAETAKYLGLASPATLATWRHKNRYAEELPWVLIGRKVMYNRGDVERFIELRTIRRSKAAG